MLNRRRFDVVLWHWLTVLHDIWLQGGSQEKHRGQSGGGSHYEDEKGGDEWKGKKGSSHKYHDRNNSDDFNRHSHSDKYKYGHAEGYKLTPGFYSWG